MAAELLVVGVVGPMVGALAAWLAARRTAQPAADLALTERFKALVDRQESERTHLESDLLKLEAVAQDLEIMVIRLLAWSDQVTQLAERQGWELPERPKFRHVS